MAAVSDRKYMLKIYCVVPQCPNTKRNHPDKLFFSLPKGEKLRRKWCRVMKRDEKRNPKLSSVSSLHCCEDHFNLGEDVENYWQYKLMENVHPRLKKGVIPHIFACQKQKAPPLERQVAVKRRRRDIINDAIQEMSDQAIQDPIPSTSKDSTIISEEGKFQKVGTMLAKEPKHIWSTEDMSNAVLAVRNNEMKMMKAAQFFNVPHSTLHHRIAVEDFEMSHSSVRRKFGLPPIIEEILISNCLIMEKRLQIGITVKDILQMALELAEKYKLPHPFPKKDKRSKWGWVRGFLSRHPDLTICQARATSADRVKNFGPDSVKQFFDIYESLLEKIDHAADRLYSCCTTGLSVNHRKTPKVSSYKAKMIVDLLPRAERESFLSILTCMNAAGRFIPPLFVYSKNRMTPSLSAGIPSGAIALAQKSAWVEMEHFKKWFHQFLKHVKPTKETPVLMLLDGHYDYTEDKELIAFALGNGVHLVPLPKHSLHVMQPLELSLVPPLKIFYEREVNEWIGTHLGMVSHDDVACLLGKAYPKAVKVAMDDDAFRKCGLLPCNRNTFGNAFPEPGNVNKPADRSADYLIIVDSAVQEPSGTQPFVSFPDVADVMISNSDPDLKSIYEQATTTAKSIPSPKPSASYSDVNPDVPCVDTLKTDPDQEIVYELVATAAFDSSAVDPLVTDPSDAQFSTSPTDIQTPESDPLEIVCELSATATNDSSAVNILGSDISSTQSLATTSDISSDVPVAPFLFCSCNPLSDVK